MRKARRKEMKNRIFFLFLAGLFLSSLAQAEEGGWEFRLAPYLWFAGLKGDIATIPPLPAVPIDISSSDALKDTEAALMLMFEAKNSTMAYFLILSIPICNLKRSSSLPPLTCR
jgi:hypothetical protein